MPLRARTTTSTAKATKPGPCRRTQPWPSSPCTQARTRPSPTPRTDRGDTGRGRLCRPLSFGLFHLAGFNLASFIWPLSFGRQTERREDARARLACGAARLVHHLVGAPVRQAHGRVLEEPGGLASALRDGEVE